MDMFLSQLDRGGRRRHQSGPASPFLLDKSTLKKSFVEKQWPHHLENLVDRLVENNFSYSGSDDAVRCCSCKVIINNWKEDDEPWKMHAKYNKNCVFLRYKYGHEIDEWALDAGQRSKNKKLRSEKNELEAKLEKSEQTNQKLSDYAIDLEKKIENNSQLEAEKDQLKAEIDQLKAEKANMAVILREQLEHLNEGARRNAYLEQQLGVNNEAFLACMEFGYSRETMIAVAMEWQRRHGYRGADLMSMLMEVSGEGPSKEGAAGRQEPSGLLMDLKEDFVSGRREQITEDDDGRVVPSGQ